MSLDDLSFPSTSAAPLSYMHVHYANIILVGINVKVESDFYVIAKHQK